MSCGYCDPEEWPVNKPGRTVGCANCIDINLYNKDCRDVMANMADGIVKVAVFDPPYRGITGGTPNDDRRPQGILSSNDGKIFKHNSIAPGDYLIGLYRVMAEQSHVYMMTNFHSLEDSLSSLRIAGFEIHNLLIWEKNNCTPSGWYMKNVEYTIFARKGKAYRVSNGKAKADKTCHHFKNPSSPKRHETEKPVELMQMYIENSSEEGDVIFDPFMGAGATAVACVNSSRRFIGCEIDTSYFNITAERVGQAPRYNFEDVL
jgi:DNA modification methylase